MPSSTAAAAVRELARRELARRSLMDFVKLFNPAYTPGWVHHEVVDLLEAFIEAVEQKKSPRLIIELPPRIGKSELISRKFPPYVLGHHPEWEVVCATYNQDLANDFGRDVRAIVNDPIYRDMFPDLTVRRDSNAVDYMKTTRGGSYTAVGIGGALTGRGLHCLPPGTRIATPDGERLIEDIAFSPCPVSVMAYATGLVTCRVTAVAARQTARLLRVTTATGRVVEATADHRFLTPRGYIQAAELAAGDRLLCLVRNPGDATGLPAGEGHPPGLDHPVLLESVLGESRERHPEAGQDLSGLPEDFSRPGADLLHTLRESPAAGSECRDAAGEHHPMYPVRKDVPPGERDCRLLLAALRRADACDPDDRLREPNLEGWALREVRGSAQLEDLSRSAPQGHGARWACVRRMPEAREVRSPLRPGFSEQHRDESGDALFFLPHASAQLREGAEADTVAMVESLCRESLVFDLEVEGAHNVFANGILTHNCGIIDDPVKNREEADSELVREAIWKWYQSVFRTRAAPGAGIIALMTRWHLDDLVGKLQLQMQENPDGDRWLVYSYPAIASKDEKHRKQGEALHPERWPLPELLKLKNTIDPREWSALYQQNPVPAEGIHFKAEWFHYEKPDTKDLRWYITTDFAIGEKTTNDYTVLWPFAVDHQDNIYFDIPIRARMPSMDIVEALCGMIETRRPVQVCVENVHISKTIGPYLRKRMQERRLYTAMWEYTATKDKLARSASLRGRMQQGKVFFHPATRSDVEIELLQFPAGRHDDLVDAASCGMLMLDTLMKGAAPLGPPPDEAPAWSMEWMQKRIAQSPSTARGIPHLNGKPREKITRASKWTS